MRKNPLQDEAMSDAAYVEDAASWAKRLTHAEARGPGDMENAWRRLEGRYGVPWRTFWALRYRKPREITVSIYSRLQAAYQAECQRQLRRLEHETNIARTIAGTDHYAVREAEALVANAKRTAGVPPNSQGKAKTH